MNNEEMPLNIVHMDSFTGDRECRQFSVLIIITITVMIIIVIITIVIVSLLCLILKVKESMCLKGVKKKIIEKWA